MITSQLVTSVEEVSRKLTDTRAEAKAEALEALEEIQVRVVEALGHERLRGLPNLNPGGAAFFGARIRGKTYEPLPSDRAVLVMNEAGLLMMVNLAQMLQVPASEDDINSEDLPRYVEIVTKALELHVVKATKATHNYDRCRKLAVALRHAMQTCHESEGG